MLQRLCFDNIHLTATLQEDHPYVLSGKRMYAIGMMSGAPPKVGEAHLVGEMGGLWAQPFKALDSWGLSINGETAELVEFKGMFWGVERVRKRGTLMIHELEWVDEEEPALFIQIAINNLDETEQEVCLAYHVVPNLRPCWMSTMLSGKTITRESPSMLIAFDSAYPERAVAVVAEGGLRQSCTLKPGEQLTTRVVVYATHVGGEHGAQMQARKLLQAIQPRQAHKREVYYLASRPDRLRGDSLEAAYRCALLNIKLLEADLQIGHYPISGLPEYPNLFGCDVAYSVGGLCLAGRSDLAIDALHALRNVALRQCGRVPHEVLPDGNVFHPGNTQEIPQFVSAVRRVVELTEDTGKFAKEMYLACRTSLLNYLRGAFTLPQSKFPDYPFGNAMVEKEGMAPIKLDTVCYTWRALHDFASLARHLQAVDSDFDYAADAADALAWAERIAARFEDDWWIDEAGLYADSLDWDGRRQLDKHWTQIVPLEVGLASPERARRVLDTIIQGWVNEYGMPHTLGADERVWTLPTALLAKTAITMGDHEVGVRLLQNIASTLTAPGQLGTFKELIPSGLCFIQLWSAAMFVELYEMLHSGKTAHSTRVVSS